MTTVDTIITIVVLGAAFLGYRKGLVMQLASLGAVVAAIVGCRLWGAEVADIFAGPQPTEEATLQGTAMALGRHYLATVLGRAVLFSAIFIGVRVVTRFCRSVTRAMHIGFLDRIGGALFSCFEWLLGLSLIFNLWLVIRPSANIHTISTMFNGHAGEAIVEFAPMVLGYCLKLAS